MLTRSDFDRLIKEDHDPAATLLMPLEPSWEDRRINATRLKNQLRALDEAMATHGMDPDALRDRLGPADESPAPLWSDSARGFALFAGGGKVRMFDLPVAVDEDVVVGSGFHVAPLLPAVDAGGDYHLLCADQGGATLCRGDRFHLVPDSEEATERSFAAIAGLTELEGNVGFHSSGSAQGRHSPSQYHAQGDTHADYHQTELDEFARGVARAVEEAMGGRTTPLVLAAEPNLLGMLRDHVAYSGLVPDAIAKAPVGLTCDTLHAESWPLVEPIVDAARIKAAGDVAAGLGRGDGSATDEADEVVQLAEQGRVAVLLLADDHAPMLPGEEAAQAGGQADSTALDPDLSDRIVKAAWTHGAELHALPRASMPRQCAVAALLYH